MLEVVQQLLRLSWKIGNGLESKKMKLISISRKTELLTFLTIYKLKIISKFKDYYDFLIGKYGVDEKIIYNRVDSIVDVNEKGGSYSPFYSNKDKWIFHIAFCGTIYVVVKIGEVSYYNSNFNLLPHDVKEFVLDYNNRYFRVLERKNYHRHKKDTEYQFIWNLKQTDFNEKFNEPILLLSGSGKTPICANIKLSDYGFQKVLIAEEVTVEILLTNY